MPWELHQPAELGARHGREEAVRLAERLKALLERNGLSPPRFPGMVWVEDQLPDGTAVAVGIAEGEDGPLAYVFPADRVEFDRTEEVAVEEQTPDGTRAVTLHWFTPGGRPG